MGAVHEIVDPKPAIEERLRALVAEYGPRIDEIERAVAGAAGNAKRDLKAERRKVKRAYTAARRKVRGMRGPGVSW
jgi:hypothetical protein